jgi:hypothetical protein
MIDRVAVKGKNDAVRLYEVIDAEPPRRRDAKLATRERLHSAMENYFGREFETALEEFERLSSEDPDDAVPLLFAARCDRYLRAPPPLDWQGFEKLDEK